MPDRAASPVIIVAELRTNHYGDRERLEQLIRLSRAAGADFVKLQKRDERTFFTEEERERPFPTRFGQTFGDYRLALDLAEEDFAFVDALCRELGIGWFASVLDRPSFDFVMALDPAMLKLPSTISEHREFLSHVAANYTGDIVVSTGMTDASYVEWVVETFGRNRTLHLLQCTSAYPTPPEDCDIAVIRSFAELARRHGNIVPGYASHDEGWKGSIMAVAAGARMIEKHVTLPTLDGAPADPVALDLTTGAFAEYVAEIRQAERMLGDGVKRVRPSEHHKYRRTEDAN